MSPAELDRLLEHARNTGRSASRAAGLPAQSFIDIATSLMQFKAESNGDDGARVQLMFSGQKTQSIYLTREDGGFRLFDSLENESAPVAWHAFNLAAGEASETNLGYARQYLDSLRESLKPVGGDDPLASAPFTHLWIKGSKASASEIRLASASLAISDRTAAETLPVLQQALDNKNGPASSCCRHNRLSQHLSAFKFRRSFESSAHCSEVARKLPGIGHRRRRIYAAAD